MKVLVLSHTYITRVGREKWRELVRLYDIELRIVVPSIWKDYLFTIKFNEHRDDELDVVSRPVLFSGKEAAHLYLSPTMEFQRFKPDIFHAEEGTDAVSYMQGLIAKSIFAPKAKTLFFTWMNFRKQLHFPFSTIERFNLARSDRAITGNRDARDILREKGFTKPIDVLPLLGIDPGLFCKRDGSALREKLGLSGVVVGFIGRFVPEKGVLDLLTAAATLKTNVTLLFIGGGSSEPAMRAKAKELGLTEHVRILRSIPHADIPFYINAMDVLVLPSYTVPHWKEQFGQVLVQAMASEVPVIGSTHAEIPNVIGDAGFVFPERDIKRLGETLRRLVDDEGLRRELGKKGRERVLAYYTNTKIAEATYSIYRKLLEGDETCAV